MDRKPNESFGQYLRRLREAKGYSMNQLAMYAGLSNSYISRLESGEREPPSPDTLKKLSEYLPATYIDLMKAAGHLTLSEKEKTDEILAGLEAIITEFSDTPPWMEKLRPETRARLEAVGGLRNFHTRFLGGTSLNDLDQHDLEIIMQVYFRHLEASEKKRKAKEKED